MIFKHSERLIIEISQNISSFIILFTTFILRNGFCYRRVNIFFLRRQSSENS